MPPNHDKAQQRRARSAEARKRAQREDRRRRAVRVGGIGLAAAALVAGLTVTVVTADHGDASTAKPGASAAIPADPLRVAVGRTTTPPWDAPADATARAAAAGLPMLDTEGVALHIHAQLNVIVNGNAVPVPADIGIDEASRTLSPLHTHDGSGVIHVESPSQAAFTLGQFMTEWDVTLNTTQLGGLTATDGNTLRWYVNGVEQTGDPSAYELRAHDVITLVYGPAGQQVTVPATYDWPAGL